MKAEDPVAQACAQLIIGAFFFTMRSCEYSKTTSPGESKTTKILTVGNIRFFKESRVISHSDPHLSEADIVAITFESQKNKDKFKTICMHRSNRCFAQCEHGHQLYKEFDHIRTQKIIPKSI
jgi:hypothetical protein